MSVTAPPRPPGPSDPVERDELDALVQALIEEARRRARRRRLLMAAVVTGAALVGLAVFLVFDRTAQSQSSFPQSSARPGAPGAAAKSTIAFLGIHDHTDPAERNSLVYVVNPDGSGKRVVSRMAWAAGGPVWSPDGQRMAFVSIRHRNKDIYVMNADGSGEHRVTRYPTDDRNPSWSPDGRKIAFTSDRDHSPGGNAEVYVIDADGSGERRLTHGNLVVRS